MVVEISNDGLLSLKDIVSENTRKSRRNSLLIASLLLALLSKAIETTGASLGGLEIRVQQNTLETLLLFILGFHFITFLIHVSDDLRRERVGNAYHTLTELGHTARRVREAVSGAQEFLNKIEGRASPNGVPSDQLQKGVQSGIDAFNKAVPKFDELTKHYESVTSPFKPSLALRFWLLEFGAPTLLTMIALGWYLYVRL